MLTASGLAGLLPALVTPFSADGAVEVAALRRLIERMFAGGARGIVPLGGTGEYTALSPAERRTVAETAVAAAAGRGPVVAGVLSPGYAEALAAAQDFKSAGVDAVMLLSPFYALGTQAGLIDYIHRFRDACGLPIVLYEIPVRTNVSLEPETIATLAADGTAIGIKFSNYDVPRFHRLAGLVGDDFALLGGEEPLVACHLEMGARGAVLATANLVPEFWAEIFDIHRRGPGQAAFAHQAKAQPLIDAVFAEPNPGPLKKALAIIGEPVGDVRLPLLPPRPETVARLSKVLAAFKDVQSLEYA